jgi:hypothetical protein
LGVTPLRAEDITLLCEDTAGGRSERLLEAALQELRADLPYALAVVPIGMLSKNDVQVRAKFARGEGFRAFGLRDRDFLERILLDDHRKHTFHAQPAQVKPWPLPRYCIENYLLDDDVLGEVLPGVDVNALRVVVDGAASARRWFDVTRGTIDDIVWRLRRIRQSSIKSKPADREAAMNMVRGVIEALRLAITEETFEERLTRKLDALAADMESDGPLRHRVDGRALVDDVERALALTHESNLPVGGLLSALDKQAHRLPSQALKADLRAVLEAMPASWRPAGM